MGRKLKSWEQITNGNSSPTTKTLLSQINYNELGQVMNKQLHSVDSVNFYQTIAYNYNERGWLLGSSAPLFAMNLYYNTLSIKAYNGNISYQYWGTPGNLNNQAVYTYDKLNRLLVGGTTANREYPLYDVMGNLSSMGRYLNGAAIDYLTYNYTSGGNLTNQVQSIVDASGSNSGLANGTTTYTYDGNGNELSATNTVNTAQNRSFTYNLLNLPLVATIPTGTIAYTYDAAGNKLRKVSTALNNKTDYISGIQYDGPTTPALSFIQTEEGKAVPTSTGGYDYYYYLGDNLGNTRVTFDTQTGSAAQLQKDDYFPFGMEINTAITSPKNEYLYNKKELQEELQEYDYGARFYDPVIVRWNVIDAYAEHPDQIDLSPYVYVGDRPINTEDPDGNCPPCETDNEEGDPTGNGKSIIENVVGAAQDAVTSSAFTLGSLVKGMMGAQASEYTFDYSSGERKLVSTPINSPLKALKATVTSLLGLSNLVPIDGPAAAVFSETQGVKTSTVAVLKDIKISDVKVALKQVHEELGLKKPLPKGEPGKFGSPTAGTTKKGYRLDPAHPNAPHGSPETKPHINFWDYTKGKKGKGGKHGAIPIKKTT
jgi:RHS repeat-associated protein